jgi:hypothetical protein
VGVLGLDFLYQVQACHSTRVLHREMEYGRFSQASQFYFLLCYPGRQARTKTLQRQASLFLLFTHTHTHTHTHTNTNTHTHTLTHSLSLSHTHTQTFEERIVAHTVKAPDASTGRSCGSLYTCESGGSQGNCSTGTSTPRQGGFTSTKVQILTHLLVQKYKY